MVQVRENQTNWCWRQRWWAYSKSSQTTQGQKHEGITQSQASPKKKPSPKKVSPKRFLLEGPRRKRLTSHPKLKKESPRRKEEATKQRWKATQANLHHLQRGRRRLRLQRRPPGTTNHPHSCKESESYICEAKSPPKGTSRSFHFAVRAAFEKGLEGYLHYPSTFEDPIWCWYPKTCSIFDPSMTIANEAPAFVVLFVFFEGPVLQVLQESLGW